LAVLLVVGIAALMVASLAAAKGKRGPRGPSGAEIFKVKTPAPGEVTFVTATISVPVADGSKLKSLFPQFVKSPPAEILLGRLGRPHELTTPRGSTRDDVAELSLEIVGRVTPVPAMSLPPLTEIELRCRKKGICSAGFFFRPVVAVNVPVGLTPVPEPKFCTTNLNLPAQYSVFDPNKADSALPLPRVAVVYDGLERFACVDNSGLAKANADIQALGGGVLGQSQLDVGFGGTGMGTVTITSSIPSFNSGRKCSGTCEVELPFGDTVTLTPAPVANSNFAAWGRGCAGTGICTLQWYGRGAEPSFPAVTAAFNMKPPTPGCSTALTNQGTANEVVSNTTCTGGITFDGLEFTATGGNTFTAINPESGQAQCLIGNDGTQAACELPNATTTSGPIDLRFANASPFQVTVQGANGATIFSTPPWDSTGP
jgi:hypothetical protein